MVMVVADTVLEASRRSRRLNATNQTLRDEQGQRVVDRLQRDGADFRAHDVGHGIGGDVWLRRHRAEHSQSLRRDLNATLTEKFGRL